MNLKLVIFSLLVMVSLAATNTDQSPKIEVPVAVLQAMSTHYPNAENVKWEMEDDEEYEAAFKMNHTKMSATFKEDGTWIETETKLKRSDLPKAVKKAIALEFEGYDVAGVEKLETPEYVIVYEVSLENEERGSELEILFTPEGEILKETIESEN